MDTRTLEVSTAEDYFRLMRRRLWDQEAQNFHLRIFCELLVAILLARQMYLPNYHSSSFAASIKIWYFSQAGQMNLHRQCVTGGGVVDEI